MLRADRDTIVVGARSNVQDGCVLHADPGMPLSVGSDVTIGHNATLHGCTIEDLVLIGMGAIVLNGARVARHSIVAAGTVLTEGQQVPEGVLVAGVPGKVRRDVSETERAEIERNTTSVPQGSPSSIAAAGRERNGPVARPLVVVSMLGSSRAGLSYWNV